MCPNQQYSFPGSHPSWLLIQLNRSMYDFGFCSSPLTVFHLTTQCTNDISTSVTEYSMLKFQRHRFWFSTVLGKIILSSEWRLNQHKKPGKGDRSSSGPAAQSQLILHTMPPSHLSLNVIPVREFQKLLLSLFMQVTQNEQSQSDSSYVFLDQSY